MKCKVIGAELYLELLQFHEKIPAFQELGGGGLLAPQHLVPGGLFPMVIDAEVEI